MATKSEPERMAYSVGEIHTITRLSRSFLYELIHAGDLPARQLKGRIVILKPDLDRFLNELPMVSA